jgi:hypothetical protein
MKIRLMSGFPEGGFGVDAGRIRANVAAVRARIAAACARAGRPADSVTLVAVTKTETADAYAVLLEAGVRDVAENRIQEAERKLGKAPPEVRRHLVGHLQTNKVRRAVGLFDVVHSVDSERLALALSEQAARAGRSLDVFVEINSGEKQKQGLTPEELPPFLGRVASLPALRWLGLMTMAPLSGDPEDARPYFRTLASLARAAGPSLAALSMGMSNDFEVAVEEGATHVRIGRALFA